MEQNQLIETPLGLLRQQYLGRLPSVQQLHNWHEFWLLRCLELALGGLGRVAPNPLVGAVLVRPKRRLPVQTGQTQSRQAMEKLLRSDSFLLIPPTNRTNWQLDWPAHFELLGEGYHAAWGQLHAEAAAFADAAQRGYGPTDFRQAILYCNLEPCGFRSADKRQPPCCEQIIRQQVGAVVFANSDPNPAVAGRGAVALRKAGLLVRSGDLALPCALFNQIFFHSVRHCQENCTPEDRPASRPWISLKLAQSLDGCIATKSGHSQWISGPVARSMVQALRAAHGAQHSAVAVGRGTLEADDPSLLLRPETLAQLARPDISGAIPFRADIEQQLASRQPWRVVWDSELRSSHLPLQFYNGPQQQHSIAICQQDTVLAAQSDIATIAISKPLRSPEGLAEALARLSQPPYWAQHLLLEGGARLTSSFLAAGLVDEVYCFISQRFIGGGLPGLQDLYPDRQQMLPGAGLALRHSSYMPITERGRSDWNGPEELLCHGYLREIFVP